MLLSFSTNTRSCSRRVFSIEMDGMMNICPTNPRSSAATMTAPTTTAVSSRKKAST